MRELDEHGGSIYQKNMRIRRTAKFISWRHGSALHKHRFLKYTLSSMSFLFKPYWNPWSTRYCMVCHTIKSSGRSKGG